MNSLKEYISEKLHINKDVKVIKNSDDYAQTIDDFITLYNITKQIKPKHKAGVYEICEYDINNTVFNKKWYNIFEAFDKNTLKIDTDLIYDKLQIDKNYYIDVYTRYHPTTKSLISLVSILENDASGIILGQIRVEHSPIDKLIFDIRYDEDTYKLEKSLVKIADYILEIYE